MSQPSPGTRWQCAPPAQPASLPPPEPASMVGQGHTPQAPGCTQAEQGTMQASKNQDRLAGAFALAAAAGRRALVNRLPCCPGRATGRQHQPPPVGSHPCQELGGGEPGGWKQRPPPRVGGWRGAPHWLRPGRAGQLASFKNSERGRPAAVARPSSPSRSQQFQAPLASRGEQAVASASKQPPWNRSLPR